MREIRLTYAKCHPTCKTCETVEEDACLTCFDNAELVDGMCKCLKAHYLHYLPEPCEASQCVECKRCDPVCVDCKGPGIDDDVCVKCSGGQLIQIKGGIMTCVDGCDEGYYENGKYCYECLEICDNKVNVI